MDKSEGKDFISKTFSSFTEKVAQWYHTGNVKLSLSTLQRSRSEKVQALGNKVLELLENGKQFSSKDLNEEHKAIIEIDKQIVVAEADLEIVKKAGKEAAKTAKKNGTVAAKASKTDKASKAKITSKAAKLATKGKKDTSKAKTAEALVNSEQDGL